MSYIDKIIKFAYSHRLSANIRERFHQALLAHQEDESQTATLEEVWNDTGFPSIDSSKANEAYARLQARLGLAQEKPQPTKHNSLVVRHRAWIYVAAACLLALVALSPSYYFYRESTELKQTMAQTMMVEEFVAAGERQFVVLPDSTHVWLNSGSLLVYPSLFTGNKREVYLSGEAYFEVKKNEKQPFIVNVKSLDVEVLGTRFNVLAYPDSKQITTTLEQGAVQIRLKGEDEQALYRLKPNEQLVYHTDSKRVDKTSVAAVDYSDWRMGGLFLDNVSFKEVLRTLERTYNISIHLQTSIYNHNHVTVHFNKNESLENVFMLLSELISGLDYQIDGNDVYLE